MYYTVDDDDQRYTLDEVIERCITSEYWSEDTDAFDQYLDSDGPVEVRGYSFSPSRILYELDEEAYNDELYSWADESANEERRYRREDLENAEDGDEVYACDYTITCHADDEDEEEEDEDDPLMEEYKTGVYTFAFAELERKIQENQKTERVEAEKEAAAGKEFMSVLGIQVI